MGRFTDDYRDATVGAGIPTGWQNRYSASNLAVAVASDGTSPGGKTMTLTKTGAGRPLIAFDAADGDNQSIVALIEMDSSDAAPSVWINGAGSSGSEDGYMMELVPGTNTLGLWEANSGTFTSKDSAGKTISTGTRYWCRLARFSNGDIRGRIWESGNVEPTTWDVEANDSTHTTGFGGVSELGNVGTIVTTVHYVSIGNGANYDTGCTTRNEDFPEEGFYYNSGADDSFRIMNLGGSVTFVVGFFWDDSIQNVRQFEADQTVYATIYNSGVYRYDKHFLNRTKINTSGSGFFGLAIKESSDEIFYSSRINGTQNVWKDSKNGGSQSSISNTTGFFTAGGIFYEPIDDLIYWAIHTVSRSMDTSGTTSHNYPSYNDGLTICSDGTDVWISTWNAQNLSETTVGGASWTTRDTTASNWSLNFRNDLNRLIAAQLEDDRLVYWSGSIPTAANRTDLLTGIDQPATLTYFNFPAAGSGSGSGSGDIPGSGSGSGDSGSGEPVGPGSGGPEEDCYGTIHRDGYDRVVIWQERTGNVLDVMGNEALNIGTPVGSTDYFDGGKAEVISKDDAFRLDLLKGDALHHLKKMVRQGCEFRLFGIGRSVVQTWFVNTKASLVPTRRGAGSMAGARFETVSRHKSSAICQSVNVLECFPWNMSVAVERTETVSPGSGSGSGSGSPAGSGEQTVSVWELRSRRDDTFEGPLWIVAEGTSVDGLGRLTKTPSSSASLTYTFPVQGVRLLLTGNWAGTLVCKSYLGVELDTFTKTNGNDLSVTIPDETWTVEWTVTEAFEQPRAVVEYAGQKVAARNGACVDCSDPNAQAASVDWSDLAPEIFFIDADTDEFKTLSGDFAEELGTGLDLSPYSIIDIAMHQPTLTVYGLGSTGKVYSWLFDGSQFGQVFDTGFSDIETIQVDNKNDRIVIGTHFPSNPVIKNIYLYSLTGVLFSFFESRYHTRSIGPGPSEVCTIGGTNYVFTYDGNVLYRFDVDDGGAAVSTQGYSVLEPRIGYVDDINNVGYRVGGSGIYSFNPILANNPDNAPLVAGNAPVNNSDFADYFDFDNIRYMVGCGGGQIWSWRVGSANAVQGRSTANALTLCTKRPFSTT